jgi:12-oxophytodienoic acid reductase
MYSCVNYDHDFYALAYMPGGKAPISSTNKKAKGTGRLPSGKERAEFSTPRALTSEEIPAIVNHFRLAARNAMAAGNFGFSL